MTSRGFGAREWPIDLVVIALHTQALSNLSQIANVSTSQQSNGQFNVSIGGISVVQGSEYRGLTTKLGSDPTGTMPVTSVVTADTGQPVNITGGSLGGLMAVRDTHLQNAITTLDTIASSLITSVNSIHSQGQGLTGFTSVGQGRRPDWDATLALNDIDHGDGPAECAG